MNVDSNEFHGKYLPFDDASDTLRELQNSGKVVVQCHGTFDLIHPGHIYHLEEAKALGDILVVTITAEAFVNKGPGRPFFNDHLRVKAITELECVDYAILIPFAAAVEAIDCVQPNIYCKGKEYEDASNDPTGNIRDDLLTVEKHGGKVEYIGSVVFSSTKLLNRHFEVRDGGVKKFCEELSDQFPPDRIRKEVDSFTDLKVLVVGDLIFDRYSRTVVQGLTSKNKTVSARHLETETHAGGSLAVVRHLQQFTPHVKLVGLIGTEDWVEDEIAPILKGESNQVIASDTFTTVVKHRYVELEGEDKEVGKLFSVNYLNDSPPDPDTQERVLTAIEENIVDVDLVIVMDFGHGLMQKKHRGFVEQNSPLLALNCQTNSFNHGFNIINRKYQRADIVTIDTKELCLARAEREFDAEEALVELAEFLDAEYAFFTRGESPTLGFKDGVIASCPAFESVVRDAVGAGDAFCSVAALAAAKNLPVEVATFLGQVAGAQAVKIVGNRESIDKGRFLKSVSSLLSF